MTRERRRRQFYSLLIMLWAYYQLHMTTSYAGIVGWLLVLLVVSSIFWTTEPGFVWSDWQAMQFLFLFTIFVRVLHTWGYLDWLFF